MGRSAILGEQRNNDFIDVCCGRGELKDYTYAITKSGLLCEFNNRRLLDRWVELKVKLSSIILIMYTCSLCHFFYRQVVPTVWLLETSLFLLDVQKALLGVLILVLFSLLLHYPEPII